MCQSHIEVDTCFILPLWALYTDPARGYPRALDAAVSRSHCDDYDSNLHIATRAKVRLLPLGGEADGELLQDGICLHQEETI